MPICFLTLLNFRTIGALDPASVLEQIELEVGKVKEQAFSRKDILEKVEKWLSAREEEEWLEEYNMVVPGFLLSCFFLLPFWFVDQCCTAILG